jgi:predicted ATPase/DNA-binding SARP family transcriptional activator
VKAVEACRPTATVGGVLVRVLGPLDVETDSAQAGAGADLPALGGPRQRSVLAVLVMHAGDVVSAETLLDAVWPDSPPPTARGTLQAYVSRLRSILGPDRLQGVDGGYRLRLGRTELDAWLLEDALAAAEHDSPLPAAQPPLVNALTLWRGRPLGDLSTEIFATAYVAALERCHVRAVCVAARHLLDGDDADAAVRELLRAGSEHPLESEVVALLMTAYQRQRRADAAIGAFRSFSARLRQDLGVTPDEALVRLASTVAATDPASHAGVRAEVRHGGAPNVTLPDPVHALVGRRSDLDLVAGAVEAQRLVTLVGPPGVGKSRLALEAAWRLVPAFPGGAVHVQLEGLRSAAGLLDALLAACRVTTPAGVPPMRSLARALRTRGRSLLVLDAAEHLAPSATDVVGQLVTEVTTVHAVLTSHAACGLDGERVVGVDPLTVPQGEDRLLDSEAGTLLADRAALSQPGFAVTPSNEAALSRIVRHLDGLPLAVELAAGQLAVLGPAELERRLRDRFDVLLAPGPYGRHVSLRAALATAMEDLDPHSRAVAERLGVLAGPVPFQLAERLVSDVGEPAGPTPRTALLGLARRSLLTVDQSGITMLETVREYCAARLRFTGAWDAAVMRHADVLVEELERRATHRQGADQCASAEVIEALSAEISVAVDRAGDAVARRLAALAAPWWYRSARLDDLADAAGGASGLQGKGAILPS